MNFIQNCFYAPLAKGISILGVCAGLSTLSAASIVNPQLQVGPLGDALTVWEFGLDSGDSQIKAAYRADGASWSSPLTISGSQAHATEPKIMTFGDNSTVLAAWVFLDETPGVYALAAATFSPFSGWSEPTVLSTTNDDVLTDFRLRKNSNGEVVIVWDSFAVDDGDAQLWESKPNFGGSWTTTMIAES